MGTVCLLIKNSKRQITLLGSAIFTLILILAGAQILNAAGDAAILSATKSADRSTIVPSINNVIQYTIVVSNTGDTVADNVVVTDTLGADFNYVAGSLSSEGGTGAVSENSGVISWAGSLDSSSNLTVTFQVTVADSLPIGQILVNTAEITGTGSLLTSSASTEVVTPTILYMPVVYQPFPKLTLTVSRPNSANQWTASWTTGGVNATSYELQESHDPNFGSLTSSNPGDVGLNTSQAFAHSISLENVYYYRVRALGNGVTGPWSDVQKAIGGYRDDFNDSSSNWLVRRMSFLEKTYAKYGTGSEAGNLILLVDDKWDWMLASPLQPAPTVPYVIEYRMRVHDPANLVSGGMAFGGDWNFDACPEIGNVYQTDNCFNHFYNYNFIYYGAIKLQHEQVNKLEWCPSCGGSPLKRIGPTLVIDEIIGNSRAKEWHIYRVEVRADGARLYIDGDYERHFTDTSYINDPYFGVFASTWEYKPSIWFFDYFQVKPLD
jgi:uncharacterized repeat protein (TIGR01451 family)